MICREAHRKALHPTPYTLYAQILVHISFCSLVLNFLIEMTALFGFNKWLVVGDIEYQGTVCGRLHMSRYSYLGIIRYGSHPSNQ